MIRKQNNKSLDPKKYKIRILVAATNSCDDKNILAETLTNVVNNYKQDILFVTRAMSFIEKEVIEWCSEHGYPCLVIESGNADSEDIRKSMVYSSEMIIFNKKAEYPFNLYITLAKKAKIDISTIMVA